MTQVKEIIITIWDRVVFHRHHQAGEGLSLILDSLPILEKIADLEKNKSIEKEQAALLKRQVICGATQFIEAGAVIPELDAVSSHNPKQLMRAEQKLLLSPNVDSLSCKPSKADAVKKRTQEQTITD